ncbi:MAG: hypothetical protein C5B53_09890 [Candidatus Melainabacteria bacterium]|nr:MAG: hypothetical protein C5B53_09890 [Candidatus Melainabacteria bacterium]
MKLLLPLDVAHSYRESLNQLERLVPLETADVFLLYVAQNTSGLESILTSIGKARPHIDRELKERAKAVLDEVAEHLKDRCNSVITQIVQGSPPLAIEELAVIQNFDLIAMGATQTGGNPFYGLGSTAAHVVKHAPSSTLILRDGAKAEGNTIKVLFAVDGSPASLNAIRTVAGQLKSLAKEISVTVLTVVSIVGIWKFVAPVEFIASIEDNLNMAAQTILADADKALAEFGIKPDDLIVRSGEPANEIIKAARDTKADLIVLGAQGRTAVEQFFLGSVSHKASMHAPCSTVVVK